jgi:phosphatidate cytidylyltransferase
MLKTRILTAAVLLPLVLFAFIYGGDFFVLPLLAVCIATSIWECVKLFLPAIEQRFLGAAAALEDQSLLAMRITVLLMSLIVYVALIAGKDYEARSLIVCALLLALLLGALLGRSVDRSMARGTGLVMALVYGFLPWTCVLDLYLMGEQSRYVLLLMAISWCGDTGGYFGGRFFGGKVFKTKKFAPVVSPKKTWEGFFVALLSSIVGALLINLGFAGDLGSWPLMIFLGLFGGAFEQLGDLVESSIKRFARVKDSGTLLPGHGGFLDRVDGIMFAAPVIWIMLYYFK